MSKRSRMIAIATSLIAAMTIASCGSSSGDNDAAEQESSATQSQNSTPSGDESATPESEKSTEKEEPTEAEGSELTHVSFLLNWTAISDHVPYFVARDKGWYKENGLDVELVFGNGSATGPRIASGQFDFGLSDSGSIIATAGKGAPLLIVGMVSAMGPQAVWVTKDSPIKEPADLAGKKIGAPTGDTQRILFPAFAAANNFDPDSVTWVNIEPGAKYQALKAGRIDATLDFSTGVVNAEKVLGEGNWRRFIWSDYGVKLYSNAILTTAEYAKENGDVITRFLDATYKGYAWTMEHPNEGVEIMAEAVPEVDVPTFEAGLPNVFGLMKDETYAEHGLGWIDPDRMCHTVDVVQKYIEVEAKPACDTLWTDDYLPDPPVALPENMRP